MLVYGKVHNTIDNTMFGLAIRPPGDELPDETEFSGGGGEVVR